ncbi:MAG: hypothetical protein M1837_002524 [Sclerophora amabilis]|nr:MAG: hypothetical protein M1837_002524 [Sclerophora amabilis]
MAKLASLPLLRRDITYSEAKEEDVNILQQLTYVEAQENFFGYLSERKQQIQNVVARHLSVGIDSVSIPCRNEWLHGSFNVGLPVVIDRWRGGPGRRVLIRFPLPYKTGESFRPGNADEKLRCEAATYACIDQHCPDVPIPHLWGFSLSNGRIFTALEHAPLFTRCLHLELQQMENESIPVDIPRELTYSTTEQYVMDLLYCHRTRLTYQPNAIHGQIDGLRQTSAMALMNLVFPHFFDRALRRGPFALTLTDLHHSNIFVDADWHVTALVDLEWACARPLDMQHPPSWLSNQSVDTIDIGDYDHMRQEFMELFEEEESRLRVQGNCNGADISGSTRTEIMRKGWEKGNFWYCLALNSPTGLDHILYNHIQPIFSKSHVEEVWFYRTLPQYWVPELWTFIAAKVVDEQEYNKRLEKMFEVP